MTDAIPDSYWVIQISGYSYFVEDGQMPAMLRPTEGVEILVEGRLPIKSPKLDLAGATVWLRDLGGTPVCIVLDAIDCWFYSTPENRARANEAAKHWRKPSWEDED